MPDSERMGRLWSGPQEKGPRARIAIVLAGIVLLVAAGTFLWWKSRAIAMDPVTLCPLSQKPTGVTVVLVDASDEFSAPQRLDIQNHLERLRDGIARFGLVEVYAVDRVGQRLTEPLIHLCNPGSDRDVNRYYQNPQFAKRRWQRFSDTLAAEIDRQISVPSAPTSPIFEAIQAAALRTFNRPTLDGIPKRLVIISDLLQHVPGELSMYDGVPSFESFRTSPYFTKVRTDLTGIAVIVYYLRRSNVAVQGRTHITFWEEYFRSQGAVLEEVTTIFGDQ